MAKPTTKELKAAAYGEFWEIPKRPKTPLSPKFIHVCVCVSLNIDSRYIHAKKELRWWLLIFLGAFQDILCQDEQISVGQPDVAFWFFHDQPEPQKNLMLP